MIVGDGPLRPELERQARAYHVEDRVAFLGFHRDIVSLYNKCLRQPSKTG
ncbi:MAG: hypothetical protein AABZ83_15230, partial [candidate division NC10 bacterium]